jgi:UDP-N-acetylglucosamine 2-epimerase (non-hydrolysing)
MLVFGTRPEAIKMAPLIHALRKRSQEIKFEICVTGQHRHMLDQVLKIFEIEPDIDLNLMAPGQDLSSLSASILVEISRVLKKQKPDIVLVHGDTTTTLMAAMASFYEGIPVGHVEAGLRTFNLESPYPEEFNRQIVTKISRWHFAPTENCKLNLILEKVPKENITVTGNTIIDSLNWTLERISGDLRLRNSLVSDLDHLLPFAWMQERFILVTGHRRENFGNNFIEICIALRDLSSRFPFINIVYPVHLNPNVQAPVKSILSGIKNIHLIEPQSYQRFILLLKYCYIVLTDSGGIQEEAPSLGKPVLLMRDTTERPEAIEAGTVELIGSESEKIVKAVAKLLQDELYYEKMAKAHNPYGDGKAVERIMKVLLAI